jgi:hypothetical protein
MEDKQNSDWRATAKNLGLADEQKNQGMLQSHKEAGKHFETAGLYLMIVGGCWALAAIIIGGLAFYWSNQTNVTADEMHTLHTIDAIVGGVFGFGSIAAIINAGYEMSQGARMLKNG